MPWFKCWYGQRPLQIDSKKLQDVQLRLEQTPACNTSYQLIADQPCASNQHCSSIVITSDVLSMHNSTTISMIIVVLTGAQDRYTATLHASGNTTLAASDHIPHRHERNLKYDVKTHQKSSQNCQHVCAVLQGMSRLTRADCTSRSPES